MGYIHGRGFGCEEPKSGDRKLTVEHAAEKGCGEVGLETNTQSISNLDYIQVFQRLTAKIELLIRNLEIIQSYILT